MFLKDVRSGLVSIAIGHFDQSAVTAARVPSVLYGFLL
jgi:hypothetical protein